MKIDKDGEVSEITAEDFARTIKNPYAEGLKRTEKLYHGETVVIDSDIVDFFKELSKKKGKYHGKLMSETLKEYMINNVNL